MPDEWKIDYNSEDAKKMICNEDANLSSRIFAGSMALDNHLRHYIHM